VLIPPPHAASASASAAVAIHGVPCVIAGHRITSRRWPSSRSPW
jgi:hypothetical protein